MIEATRAPEYLPAGKSGVTGTRVPAAEDLVFQSMMLEALTDEGGEQGNAEFSLGALPDLPLPLAGADSGLISTKQGSSAATALAKLGAGMAGGASKAYGEAAAVSAGPDSEAPSAGGHRFVDWMDRHALTRSVHECAKFVRKGLEAAGISTSDRPRAAGDYGPYLVRHGAKSVDVSESYRPQAGDTAVFEKTAEHPFGHIQVFDGEQWISDFRQHGFSPYRDPATTPGFQVYRLP